MFYVVENNVCMVYPSDVLYLFNLCLKQKSGNKIDIKKKI